MACAWVHHHYHERVPCTPVCPGPVVPIAPPFPTSKDSFFLLSTLDFRGIYFSLVGESPATPETAEAREKTEERLVIGRARQGEEPEG